MWQEGKEGGGIQGMEGRRIEGHIDGGCVAGMVEEMRNRGGREGGGEGTRGWGRVGRVGGAEG